MGVPVGVVKIVTIKFYAHEKHIYEKLREYCHEHGVSVNTCIKLIIAGHLNAKYQKRLVHA